MEKRSLSNSDLMISKIGMGCWAYGGGSYWGEQTQRDVEEVVHAALDCGVNYFDTAEAYNDGESERSLGLALKGRRNEAVIGTKISTSNARPHLVREHCESSLKRLGTDYIDIYMLHWPINSRAIEHFTDDRHLINSPPSVQEVMLALVELQKEGKIRHIGISNHGLQQIKEIKETGVNILVNELPYNLISRGIEEGILPYCIKNHVNVFGYMAYQQGILAGKYETLDIMPCAQAHSRHYHYSRGGAESRHGEDGAEEEILYLLIKMKEISKEHGINISTLSLAWAMANEGISSTLVGSRNIDQFKMNMEALSYKLPDYIKEELDRLSNPVLMKLGTNPDYYENRGNSRIW